MKKLWQYILQKRWQLHIPIALVANFLFFYLGNQHNFLHLHYARWQGIKGTEYYFQFFLSAFLSFWVAYCWELWQMYKGANKTDADWKNEAWLDVIATTIAGVIGFVMELIFFELSTILNYL